MLLSQDLEKDMTMPETFRDEPFVSQPPPRLLRVGPVSSDQDTSSQRPAMWPVRAFLKRWAIRKLKVRSSESV